MTIIFFFLRIRRPPSSTLFPNPPLFRSLRFVASPRHADVLLVTGPVTKNMREALERTYNATPDPKWVVAVGDCAADRSEEHTSELQSQSNLVCRLLLEKKKSRIMSCTCG